jgi:hypothetical protein
MEASRARHAPIFLSQLPTTLNPGGWAQLNLNGLVTLLMLSKAAKSLTWLSRPNWCVWLCVSMIMHLRGKERGAEKGEGDTQKEKGLATTLHLLLRGLGMSSASTGLVGTRMLSPPFR